MTAKSYLLRKEQGKKQRKKKMPDWWEPWREFERAFAKSVIDSGLATDSNVLTRHFDEQKRLGKLK